MRKLLRIFGILLLTLAVALLVIIMYAQITYYEPEEHIIVYHNHNPDILSDTATISLMTWNLGYAGMGDDMDFFYDGGSQMRTSHERTLENLSALLTFLEKHRDIDIMLLQEVDRKSRRSYYINMFDSLESVLPEFSHVFGKNYDVRFVPVPWHAPMGRVTSGLVTSSTTVPNTVTRVSFPGNYPWPERLFSLQRCFLLSRYPLTNGKELVVINTHNSAFDDGSLRNLQMQYLKDLMLEEYRKGNYVIAGGDFNQCPPGFEPEFYFNIFDDQDVFYISENYMPDWYFVYDPAVPTNRRAVTPYEPASTKTTLIDFFIHSPNVQTVYVEGVHLDFQHTDHNPVLAGFRLMGPYSRPAPAYIGR